MSGRKDDAHITPDGRLLRDLIDGSHVHEGRAIVTFNGVTTEVYRDDWPLATIRQAIHVALRPGAISAWHLHKIKTDHIWCVGGHLQVVLYDDREGSPTRGKVDVHHLAVARPQLLVVPPSVWHGVRVLGGEPGVFINYFDDAYDHANPDEYRLPPDSDEIPFRF